MVSWRQPFSWRLLMRAPCWRRCSHRQLSSQAPWGPAAFDALGSASLRAVQAQWHSQGSEAFDTAASQVEALWERERRAARAPTTINLGVGMPALESIPRDEVLAGLHRAAFGGGPGSQPPECWGYDGTQGVQQLRHALAEHFTRQAGLPPGQLQAANFMLDGGGGGAIATVAQTFLSPNDAVIAERPGYMGIMDSFRERQAILCGVDMDDEGMRVDHLRATIHELRRRGHCPKLLYIQAEHHNPRGSNYSVRRLESLLELCAAERILILNDNAYGGLQLGAPHRSPDEQVESPPLLLGQTGVLTVGTFSKTVAPGLRVGWLMGDSHAISLCVQVATATKPYVRQAVQAPAPTNAANSVTNTHVPAFAWVRFMDTMTGPFISALCWAGGVYRVWELGRAVGSGKGAVH